MTGKYQLRFFIICILVFNVFQIALADEERVLRFSEFFDATSIDQLEKWDYSDNKNLFSMDNNRVKIQSKNNYIESLLMVKPQYWQFDASNFDLEFDFTVESGTPDLILFFNYRDKDNYYFLDVNEREKTMRKIVKDNVVFINHTPNDSSVIKVGQTNRIRLRFYEGELFFYVDGQLSWRVSDFTFNPNHFGRPILTDRNIMGKEQERLVFIDNFDFYSIPSHTILPMTAYMQNQWWWGTEEYDHAKKWTENNSQPDMQRWGCAVTSAAMILNYYGFITLPDKVTSLDPGSLNNWLKNESDGYTKDGLLNWLALTRLSSKISQAFYIEGGENLPKLETKITKIETKKIAVSEIKQKRPIILGIYGHFLVGKGYTYDETDLLINDPGYLYNKFSDHEIYSKKQLLSVRTFVPSFTDLSYFLLVTNDNLDFKIRDDTGREMELIIIDDSIEMLYQDLYTFDEHITARQVYLAKPSTGDYSLEILNQGEENEYQIQIFLYDKEAEYRSFVLSGISNQNIPEVKIEYKKEAIEESQLVNISNFDDLISLIEELQVSEIKKKYVYLLLKQLATFGQVANFDGKKRYWQLINDLLFKYKDQITINGLQALNQQMIGIENNYQF